MILDTNGTMLSHTSVIRPTLQQDLLNELSIFIKGALKLERGNPVDLTKTALRLLKNLPAARTAVFEYFSNVFIEASSNYIEAVETEIKTGELPSLPETDETVVSEIHLVLTGFITDNPTAWAPIISTWSLELLGEISTKFAGRAHISVNLNETLQLWMNCRATKILVDINTKCLSSLMHLDTESCISALLDTSTKHSPNFDWVVAHVGSCFPNTVITRVLSCGLKDFCQIKSYEQGSNSPKLRSVVGILGHLAESHSLDIRSAILEMFQWSLMQDPHDTDQIRLQKKATVPFILQLSFLSSTFFKSICLNTSENLSVEIIIKLYPLIDDWCRYFGSAETLEDLIISLILSCDLDGYQLINLLLQCALYENYPNEATKQTIRDKSLELLQNIMFRIDDDIRAGNQVNLINSCTEDLEKLQNNLLVSQSVCSQISAQIIVFLSYKNFLPLLKTIKFLLKNSTKTEQLSLLLKILTHELLTKTHWYYAERGGYLGVAILEILCTDIEVFLTHNKYHADLTNLYKNLAILQKWESSGRVTLLRSQIVKQALSYAFYKLTALFMKEKIHSHVLAEILDDMDIPGPGESIPARVVMNLTLGSINYFFYCCEEKEGAMKTKGFKRANSILRRVCVYSEMSRVLALYELVERSIFFKEVCRMFGAKPDTIAPLNDDDDDEDDPDKRPSLLKLNRQINKTIPLTKHSSVFNGGLIGTGKRKIEQPRGIPPSVIANNIKEIIRIIKFCCSVPEENENKYNDVSLESVTIISLFLVQFISPDVMYNGLPWPDEDFAKVTMERDLHIRKMFTLKPLLWDLLNFIAVNRPALCYCSVLLRALTATLINQWRSTGDQSKSHFTENYQYLLDTTTKVIDIMALGQLLPPPLSSIRNILPYLKSFEIVAILRDCVWCYMRDHIPSPALFVCDANGIRWRDPRQSRPSENYTNTLRIIMQRNIKTLGHMYSQMFINVVKHE